MAEKNNASGQPSPGDGGGSGRWPDEVVRRVKEILGMADETPEEQERVKQAFREYLRELGGGPVGAPSVERKPAKRAAAKPRRDDAVLLQKMLSLQDLLADEVVRHGEQIIQLGDAVVRLTELLTIEMKRGKAGGGAGRPGVN